jgi:hypothetical protein
MSGAAQSAKNPTLEADMTATALCRSLLCPAALMSLLVVVGCGRPSIEGTWMGRDEQGAAVVYSFGPSGAGSRAVGATREALTYQVRRGYPDLIEITIAGTGSPQTIRGLVQLFWDGRMNLELSPPGGQAPSQLSSKALELSRPATK